MNYIYKNELYMFYGLLELFFINFSKNFHEYIRTKNLSYKIVWNHSKNHFNTIFFVFINFSKTFHKYIRTENLSYKIVWHYSKNHLNTMFFVFINFLKIFCECAMIKRWLKNHLNCFKNNMFLKSRL